ncbi:unnamed protein product [Ilex paraguariensis]|uniref:CCHC-type domain-containing protein n=1 Tax=Ilex paraguariensis TaxID=185542 RepID=A0ABC8QM54_9AQUA
MQRGSKFVAQNVQLPLPSFADIIPKALSHEIFERLVYQQSTNSAFYAQWNSSTRPKNTKKGKPKPSFDFASKSSNSSLVYCQLCDKEGHLAKHCWTFLNLKKKQSTNLDEAFAACSIPDSNDFDCIQDRVTRGVLRVDRCENGMYVLDQNHHALALVVSSNKSSASVHL